MRYQAVAFSHIMLVAHLAITKTKYACKKLFWWPGMDLDIIKYVNCCAKCLQTKGIGKDTVPHGKTYTPILPFDCLTIDIVTPGTKTTTGHQHVLVIVDVISRYGWFLPLKNRKTVHVLEQLHKYIFNHWGFPAVKVYVSI